MPGTYKRSLTSFDRWHRPRGCPVSPLPRRLPLIRSHTAVPSHLRDDRVRIRAIEHPLRIEGGGDDLLWPSPFHQPDEQEKGSDSVRSGSAQQRTTS